MINVNQITSQLAKMPDQALQKYAALNKNDPYILALAVAESNRRKEMRQAAQGAQGMMPQPKVADQAVQGMAPAAPMGPAGPAQPMPEDMGIGRLPAGDMNFADGGIVAFADGGEVERYNGLEGSFTGRPAPTSMFGAPYSIPGMQIGAQPFMPQAGAPEQTPWLRRKFAEMQASMETGAAERQLSLAQSRIAAGRGSDTDFAIVEAAKQKAGPTAQDMAQFDAATNLYMTERAAKQAASAADAVKAPPKLDTAKRPPSAPRTQPTPGAAPAPGITGLDVGKMTEDALAAAAKAPNPFAGAVEALGKERVAAKEEDVKGLEAIQKQFSDIYKGRKERLDTREAEIGKMKDQSLGLALLQAGAAMMTTPGNVGMALGKGVQVGSERYVAGLDKVRAAQEKLSDARDRLEEIEAQRGEMSARELLKARSDVRNTALSAREDMIKSNMQIYGVNRETAMKIVDNQIKVGLSQAEIASRERVSANDIASRERIASMPGAQERLFATLGGGDVAKGFERYISATGPEAKGEAALVAQFAKDPAALQVLKQSNPQLAALIEMRMSTMLMPGVQTTPGAGGARP